jgi:DNA-binding beta-propeller fold protein YncE
MLRHLPTSKVIPIVAWFLSATTGSQAHTSIVLTLDERTVCVANQDSGSVSLWDWQVATEPVEIPVGDEPRMLALIPGNRLVCVTTQRSQELALVDLTTHACIRRIPIGGQPVGVTISSDGRYAFVAQFAGDYWDGEYHAGSVAVVDLQKQIVHARISVRPCPFAMAMSTDGHQVYVSHYLAVDGTGWVSEIDAHTFRVTREFSLDEDLDSASGRGGVFNGLASLAVHPRENRLLVAGMQANVHRGLKQSGQSLSHKTTVQAAVRCVDLTAGEELVAARMVSSFSGQAVAMPSAVAFLGNGEYFVDVYFASHDMKVLAYNETGTVAERSLFELPHGPTGIAVTRDGQQAFVNCRWTRSVAHIDLANIRQPRMVRSQLVTEEPWDAQRILGARLFHDTRDTRMTPNRWLSCAVCHLDGGELSDGLIWEFTTAQKPSSPALVNPKSLAITRGSGPPYLIQGTYRTIHEEDQFIRSFLGGRGFLTSAASVEGKFAEDPTGKSTELDALSQFVLNLRPRPNPHLRAGRPRGEIAAAANRGREIFHSAESGCSQCHAGPNFTRSGTDPHLDLADVGTGIQADIPSLNNVWETAPYLHDGRAKTLREVITTHNPDDRHGKTSHLSAQQRDDLVAFLLAPHEDL